MTLPRYSDSAVRQALDAHWPIADGGGGHCYVSRLTGPSAAAVDASCSTTVFLVKRRKVRRLNALTHVYLSFDAYTWHPGSPHDPIITDLRESERLGDTVSGILEMCTLCARAFMERNFKQDSRFNLVFNNCQIQLGFVGETMCAMGMLGALFLYGYTSHIVFLVVAMVCCGTLLKVGSEQRSYSIWQCPHVAVGSMCRRLQ